MLSLPELETNTRSAVTTTPEGLLPPSLFWPKGTPVRMKASTLAAAGLETSTTHSELDSGTLGSPRPGTCDRALFGLPLGAGKCVAAGESESGEGQAGGAGCAGSAPGISRYSNIPTLVT